MTRGRGRSGTVVSIVLAAIVVSVGGCARSATTTTALRSPRPSPSSKPSTAPIAKSATPATTTPTAAVDPGPRVEAVMSDDPKGHGVLLYGGLPSGQAESDAHLTDTWRWAGAWKMANDSGPGPFTGASMATGPQKVLLVGLSGSSGHVETYLWTGSLWTHVAARGPRADSVDLTYDVGAKRFVLLVSTYSPSSTSLFALTAKGWTRSWTSTGDVFSVPSEIVPAPVGKSLLGLGISGLDHQPTDSSGMMYQHYEGVLYRFNGTTWDKLSVKGTPAEVAELAFDPVRRRIVVVGGAYRPAPDAGPGVNATFEFDGVRWIKRSLPKALWDRVAASMSYDSGLRCVVLYAGVKGMGLGDTPPRNQPTDTWRWTSSWSPAA